MKIYLRGPMDEFTFPLNDEATESLTFKKKIPGQPAEIVAVEVKQEIAAELLTHPRGRFSALNPEEGEKAVENFKPKPSKPLRGRRGIRLKPNTPAIEQGNEEGVTPVNPLVPVNPDDPLIKNAINDPRKTK